MSVFAIKVQTKEKGDRGYLISSQGHTHIWPRYAFTFPDAEAAGRYSQFVGKIMEGATLEVVSIELANENRPRPPTRPVLRKPPAIDPPVPRVERPGIWG